MYGLWRCLGRARGLQKINLDNFRQNSTAPARKKQTVFYMDEVQDILKSLTTVDIAKVFRPRKEGHKTERSTYQFLTTEELEKMQKEYDRRAREKLQMPPVMDERDPQGRVLEKDPLLVGFDNSKIVFTDITYGVADRERLIVVRDTDGTLRTADWDEQDRINLIYFPREECKHYVPPMFKPENLTDLMDQGQEKYEYILDRNCGQFEPDHPTFIRTAELVYNHINEKKNFRALESTRHYGPLIFFLCWSKQIDEHKKKIKGPLNLCTTILTRKKIFARLSQHDTTDL
eukprot:TRINITY_DN16722_c0_g1_i16.p1 TRINITY_DN16722_c0_g1~~TRINITY_DN16722_c0_g1_i16.p1  ORF type:complete len:288 (-),score=28.27 TRINITY_DN16722_c0_g1_i16:353-1216(-)